MKIYILSRYQTEACCRLNSAAAAAYIMTHPDLLNNLQENARPELIAYTTLLQTVGMLLNTIELDPPLPEKLLIAFAKGTPSKYQIAFLSEIMDKYENVGNAIKASLDAYKADLPAFALLQENYDKKRGDRLGLLTRYRKMDEEARLNPAYKRTESIIAHAEKLYSLEPDLKNTGIFLEKANGFFADPQALIRLASDLSRMNLTKIGLDYSAADIEQIDLTIDGLNFDQPVQITAGGHATIYGCTEGQYWKFDSTGKTDDKADNPLSFSTLTVFENKEEMVNALKQIMPDLNKKQSRNRTMQFASLSVQFKTPEVMQKEKDTLNAVLDDYLAKIEQYKGKFDACASIKKLEQRFSGYEIEHQYMLTMISVLEKLHIPDTFPALQEGQDILLDMAQGEVHRHITIMQKCVDDHKAQLAQRDRETNQILKGYDLLEPEEIEMKEFKKSELQ